MIEKCYAKECKIMIFYYTDIHPHTERIKDFFLEKAHQFHHNEQHHAGKQIN